MSQRFHLRASGLHSLHGLYTGFPDPDDKILARKLGVSDYVGLLSLDVDKTRLVVAKALAAGPPVVDPRQRVRGFSHEIVAASPVMRAIVGWARRVGPMDLATLITRETDVGKELVARILHASSTPREGPFIGVTCAGIPRQLVESELFGHQKGAFTGAVANRRGLIAARCSSTKWERCRHGCRALLRVLEL